MSWEVFYSETLRNPVENEESLCQSLPVTGCCAAVFLPSQNARVAVIHTDGLFSNKTISVFDLTIKETKYIKKPEGWT